jgi:hypothetical protein
VHRAAAEDDDAGPEKSDARDDLGRDPRRVHFDGAGHDDIEEPVLAHQQDQRRSGPDDGLGAQPRALALDLAFNADERGQAERDEQFHDLPGALTGTAEERVTGRQPRLHAEQVSCTRRRARCAAPTADHGDRNPGAPVRRLTWWRPSRVWLSG